MVAAQPLSVYPLPGLPYLVGAGTPQFAGLFPHAFPDTDGAQIDGAPALIVPFGPEERRVLANVGVRLPCPMRHSYDWPSPPGKPPFESQKATASFLVENRRAFVLSQMGVGKTRAALYAIDYLLGIGAVRRALIVAPLSTLTRVWFTEIFVPFPKLKPVVLYGNAKTRKKKLAEPQWLVAITNHAGMIVMLDELERGDHGIDLILFDELAVLRNRNTDQFRAAKRICTRCKYIWGMTGSPTPNTPTDAFAQTKLINPARATFSWKYFREQVEYQVAPHRWIPKAGCEARVFDMMQPAIRFTREEVYELPPVVHQFIDVPMSAQQKTFYEDMRKKLVLLHKDGQVTAANAAVLISKLAQIAGGIVYDDDAEPLLLVPQPSPRVLQLLQIIEETDDKVIVFAGYRHTVELLSKVVTDPKHGGWTCEVVHGGVSVPERNRIFADFQDSPHPRVLIAHPKTMAHGLTLTAAGTVVWYTPFFSRETYEQANARISRFGQKKSQLVAHLISAPIERHIYKILDERGKMQDACLKLFADNTI